MPAYMPLVGFVFGELTVLCRDPMKDGRKVYYLCRCSCGKIVSVRQDKLRNGQAISCGCRRRKRSDATHGMSHTRLYGVFIGMRQRCLNPRAVEYENYGGRGISVCEEWLGREGFQNFYTWAVSNGYDPDAPRGACTLDRIDVNKGYSPENCRWITSAQQATNTTRNIMIEYNGERRCLKEWGKIRGISYAALMKRYRSGWPVDELLEFQPHIRKKG